MTRYATITGVGSYLPPRLVPNTWFESIVDTNDEWIRDRTGIEARHFADEGVSTSDLALEASRKALEAAGVEPQRIDMILVRHDHRRHRLPGHGGVAAGEAGRRSAPRST